MGKDDGAVVGALILRIVLLSPTNRLVPSVVMPEDPVKTSVVTTPVDMTTLRVELLTGLFTSIVFPSVATNRLVPSVVIPLSVVNPAAEPVPSVEMGLPAVPQGAHIGISLSAHTLIFDRQLTTIYFARLEEGQDDFISKSPLIPSNASVGNRFYLLNALPGRYVAVAARGVNANWGPGPAGSAGSLVRTGEGLAYYIAFSKPLIALTEVKTEPGRLTFMGHFSVRARVQGGVRPRADEVQGNTSVRFKTLAILGSVQDVKQGVESWQEFLMKARDDLGESAWGTIIQRTLEFLQKSEADHGTFQRNGQ